MRVIALIRVAVSKYGGFCPSVRICTYNPLQEYDRLTPNWCLPKERLVLNEFERDGNVQEVVPTGRYKTKTNNNGTQTDFLEIVVKAEKVTVVKYMADVEVPMNGLMKFLGKTKTEQHEATSKEIVPADVKLWVPWSHVEFLNYTDPSEEVFECSIS